ncbi:protein PIN-LIKES 3-like [Mercurialis annua]|uniref:protein PIN-LIKES 3-like n=1 Tax=Mercurialis annua TaxID=3986 RepID=UPI00215F1AB1|nr:protein PIN-LIKES 3-like [Mercurialis annua]
MRIVHLFGIASMPVLKVLIITALGSVLALDGVNVLGEDARKYINQLVFYVLNPALVGGNLARTITFESIKLLWFMPVNILITFIVGSALGWILIKITGAPKHLKGLVLGCCAAGNMGNLPLIIVPALCKETGSPFGAPQVCQAYGLAYASLSMAIGAVYMWSYVYNMMRISANEINGDVIIKNTQATPKGDPLPSKEHPNSAEITIALLHPATESEKIVKSLSWTQLADKIKKCIGMISKKLNLKAIFAPSTTGAIMGFIIGAVPQIRNLFVGSNAPLHILEDSASFVGDAAIPIVTLIIGGNLLKGLKVSGIRLSLIFGILAVRYVLLPLVGIVTVKNAVRFGLVSSADPLYQFILLLQFAVPPAMNIGTMTQLFGIGQNECSVILLWTYGLASVSLTLWSTFFLWMVT